jgi:hypothetical protein
MGQVSRSHALIHVLPHGGLQIENLSQVNGTSVNGRPVIQSMPVQLTDDVRLGSYRLQMSDIQPFINAAFVPRMQPLAQAPQPPTAYIPPHNHRAISPHYEPAHQGHMMSAPTGPGPGFGITGMILGIISFLGATETHVYSTPDQKAGLILFSSLTLIFSAVGMAPERQGRGMATAGLVLGIISGLVWLGSIA